MASLDELQTTVAKLATVDQRREGLIRYRDEQIVAALDSSSPPTWTQLQALTGLSVRGLQLAIKRGRSKA